MKKINENYNWILFKAFVYSLKAYLVFNVLPAKNRYGKLGKEISFNSTSKHKLIRKIAKAILKISTIVPWENVCKHQTIQAVCLLRNYQINSNTFIGVEKNRKNKNEAHAWVKAEGIFVSGHCNPDNYFILDVYEN